jgi:predicted dienelactone hydrolase
MNQQYPNTPNFCGRYAKLVHCSIIAVFQWSAQFAWANSGTADTSYPLTYSAPNVPQLSIANAQPSRAQTGAFRTIDFSWKDASREREIPARLYWPENASADKPAPLVVFSHGLGGSQMGYSYLGRHWASMGIASLHVRHAGSDRGIWTANVFALFSNMQNAASEANAVARAKDVSFAITRIFEEPEHAKAIDAKSIAVAGHSYGANTAMLIGGASVLRGNEWVSFRDDRVRALVLISAPPFTGEGDMAKILADVKVPTLHVTGTEDVIRVPGYRSDYSDRIAVYDAQPSKAMKALTVFKGATHSIFTDRIDRAGFELNEKVKRATKEISGLFLRSVLAGDSSKSMHTWANASEQNGLIERFVPLTTMVQ